MNEENMVEKIYSTERNVAVLSKDVEQMKNDITEIKTALKKLLDEPKDDYKFLKRQIWSILIGVVFMLCGLGISVYSMNQVNEMRQIIVQYQCDK